MSSTLNLLAPALAHLPAPLLLVALLGVSLVMIFAGGTLAKVVAFLAVGLAGAALGGSLAAQYLSPAWGVLGLLLGFVVGGMLGVFLLPLGVGIAVGYAGYLAALGLALGSTTSVIVGLAFFVVGAMLSSKILSLATAVLGGLLLFGVLTDYGVGLTLAVFIAGALTLAGSWVQLGSRRPSHPPAAMDGQNARR